MSGSDTGRFRSIRRRMRILLWHGYLLGGTGSNVYTRAVAREWRRAGHDVVVVCQDRHAELYDLGGAQVVVPELPDRLLPTFVLDDYEGLEARLLQDFTRAQRDAYVEANAAAVRELLTQAVAEYRPMHDIHDHVCQRKQLSASVEAGKVTDLAARRARVQQQQGGL